MPKPPEPTHSTAVQQIRPRPLSQHLGEFASRPDAWVVLARNMIPVVGIYAFAWSAAVSVFNYWFDGLTALAAIAAALIPHALRETQSQKDRATWAGNVERIIDRLVRFSRRQKDLNQAEDVSFALSDRRGSVKCE